jgi:nucleotide-binding universal stress UspA family protein
VTDEIVVGLDDSDPSRAALRWVADQARLSGSTLRAVYVSDWPTGVRADGRPLVVEDLLFVQEGELEHTNRGAIREIFQEITPKDDWSLEFARQERADTRRRVQTFPPVDRRHR